MTGNDTMIMHSLRVRSWSQGAFIIELLIIMRT